MRAIKENMMKRGRYAVYSTLYNELEVSLTRSVNLYNKLKKENNLYFTDHDLWYSQKVTNVSETGVEIAWNTYRYSSSNSSGTIFIPVEALLDDTYEAYINELIKNEIRSKKENEIERNETRKIFLEKQLVAIATELNEIKN